MFVERVSRCGWSSSNTVSFSACEQYLTQVFRKKNKYEKNQKQAKKGKRKCAKNRKQTSEEAKIITCRTREDTWELAISGIFPFIFWIASLTNLSNNSSQGYPGTKIKNIENQTTTLLNIPKMWSQHQRYILGPVFSRYIATPHLFPQICKFLLP